MNNKQELAHHGVKGQKWGVRRYQPYRDIDGRSGSGQEIGEAAKKSSTSDSSNNKKTSTNSPSKDKKKSSGLFDPTINKGKGKPKTSPAEEIGRGTVNALRETSNVLGDIERMQSKKPQPINKSVKSMSDNELRNSINRIKMEREYSSLTAAPQKETGMQKAKEVLDTAGDVASVALTVVGIVATIKKLKGA